MDELIAGEVGYLAASIKAVADARVGDTITLKKKQAAEALAGLFLLLFICCFLFSCSLLLSSHSTCSAVSCCGALDVIYAQAQVLPIMPVMD